MRLICYFLMVLKMKIKTLLSYLFPRHHQSLLMSATLSPDVDALKKLVLHAPSVVRLTENDNDQDTLRQFYLCCTPRDKFLIVFAFLKLGLIRGKVMSDNCLSVCPYFAICRISLPCFSLSSFFFSSPSSLVTIVCCCSLCFSFSVICLFLHFCCSLLISCQTLFFTNSVERGYRLKLFLEQFSISSAVLNAELPINSRYHILQQFNKGPCTPLSIVLSLFVSFSLYPSACLSAYFSLSLGSIC